jgi:hypothetical protein
VDEGDQTMSALDQLNDIELGLIADAIRIWTTALSRAGLPPVRYVTPAQIRAVARLMDLCPAGPVAVNGEEREPA